MSHRLTDFNSWPTGAKLLLVLSLALLPLGLALAWTARDSIQTANAAAREAGEQQGRAAARAIESLVARNALALRIAANGAFRHGGNPCTAAAQSLALTPAIASRFVIRDSDGAVICAAGGFQPRRNDMLVAPGDIRLWVSDIDHALDYRVGVVGGMATGDLTIAELRSGVADAVGKMAAVSISDGESELTVVESPGVPAPGRGVVSGSYVIANGQLRVRTVSEVVRTNLFDQLAVLLPLLMWVVAAWLSWQLVKRLLIQPLGRLKRAVIAYQPGDPQLELPEKLGPAAEIRELGQAFERAVDRIEQSEREMADALEGQRRLVREVHHRVKNNLQVVASLLNIHGRSASSAEAAAAYAAIGRRVDALSVVHRNHFAEVEESRGIALRPLLVELAATLRASAPDEARAMTVQIDVDLLHTTQDAAVATAFFVTEVVEHVMLRRPGQPVEIELRRVSELGARLTISSEALMPDGKSTDSEHQQFGRVIGGLARQLRSPLEEKIGRLSVDIPVFPD